MTFFAADCEPPHVEIPHHVVSAFRGEPPEDIHALQLGLEADAYAFAANKAASHYITALRNGDLDCAERQLDAYLRFRTRSITEFRAYQHDLYEIAAAFQGTPDDTLPTADEVNAVLQTFFVKDLGAFDPREILVVRAFGIDPTWIIPNLFVADPSLFTQTTSAALRHAIDLILP